MVMQAIENYLFRKVAPFTIRYIQRPDLGTDDVLARKVLEQASREFQVAPPLTLHQADPLLMAGVWSMMREGFVVHAEGRVIREAVAAAVSEINECPYCVDVHSSMHKSAGSEKDILDGALKAGSSLEELAYQWALATLSPDSKTILEPKIPPNEVPQIYATAICFHFINRMVNIFLDEAPMPMPAANSKFMRSFSRVSLKFFGKRMVKLDGKPGEYIFNNVQPELPPEFAWAKTDSNVAGGLARFAYAAEQAGKQALHENVRALVLSHLKDWQGESPGLSRSWTNSLVDQLDDELKPSARLALLAARSPWQIDKQIINHYREITGDDKSLVQVAGWASYAAVKRIAGWLQ